MKHGLRKRDIIIIACLILAAFGFLGMQYMTTRTAGAMIEIQVAGQLYGTYSLKEDQEIPVTNDKGITSNTVVIENQQAYMKQADCPDHLCQKQGQISHQSESIVCLPNKVVVTVISGEEAEFDSVAR